MKSMSKFHIAFLCLLIGLLVCILLWMISVQKFKNPYTSKVRMTEKYEHKLINLTNFEYLINHPCDDSIPPNAIILVHSAIQNENKRKVIRETWGKAVPAGRIFFAVGAANDSSLQKQLEQENRQFQDIIQGNFLDSYRNLTYKHTMVLKWFVNECPKLKYLIKVDDDALVNTMVAFDLLGRGVFAERNLILCHFTSTDHFHRDTKSKWYVSKDEYPIIGNDITPTYCWGPAIIYSNDVARKLYEEVQKAKTPYVSVDDVHVTGIVRKYINVNFTDMGKYVVWPQILDGLIDGKKKLDDVDPDFFISYALTEDQIRKVWKIISSYFT